jgi:hypothetical protein
VPKMRVCAVVVIGLCILFATGSAESESKKGTPSKPKLSAQQRLEQFRSEVENINGKQVVIHLVDQESNGSSDCRNPHQIDIYMNRRLEQDQEWHDVVLAHELGHAYLCGKGITAPNWESTFKAHLMFDRVDPNFIRAIMGILSSCYQDRLADAEATKRGFDPSVSVDNTATKIITPKSVIVESKKTDGPLYSRYLAAAAYCHEKRNHSFNVAQFEEPSTADPDFRPALENLKKNLRGVSCATADSCYEAEKKLRDIGGFKEYVLLINPKTGALE